MMQRLRVSELMSKDVEWVEPHASLEEVALRMRDNQYSCVVVCEDEVPVGIVSERDVARVLANLLQQRREAPRTAADVMSFPVTTIEGEASLALAIAECRARRIRRLPVVDTDGCIIGIVTQTDLLRAHVRELEVQREALEKKLREQERDVNEMKDAMHTGLLEDKSLPVGNTAAMDFALQRIHVAACRYKRPYSLALIDMDRFQRFLHIYGDDGCREAMAKVSERINELVRDADSLYRFSEDQLLLLMPETDEKGAGETAERLRTAVPLLAIEHDGSPDKVVTVSIGHATWNPSRPGETTKGMIERADRGLFRAKQGGRNRVAFEPDRPASR